MGASPLRPSAISILTYTNWPSDTNFDLSFGHHQTEAASECASIRKHHVPLTSVLWIVHVQSPDCVYRCDSQGIFLEPQPHTPILTISFKNPSSAIGIHISTLHLHFRILPPWCYPSVSPPHNVNVIYLAVC